MLFITIFIIHALMDNACTHVTRLLPSHTANNSSKTVCFQSSYYGQSEHQKENKDQNKVSEMLQTLFYICEL